MVVVGNFFSTSHYGVYEASSSSLPVFSPDLAIHMSPSKIIKKGASVVAYCTIMDNFETLVEIVTGDLVQVKELPLTISKTRNVAEKTCLKYITDFNNNKKTAKPLSQLGNTDCSHKIIASLAYKKAITLEGRYTCSKSSITGSPIRINADVPIRLREFLSGRPILKSSNNDLDEALAWFQGDLHLIRRLKYYNEGLPQWRFVTEVGRKNNNGRLIAELIEYKLVAIRDFSKAMKYFESIKNEFDNSADGLHHLKTNQEQYGVELSYLYDSSFFTNHNDFKHVPRYLVSTDGVAPGDFKVDFKFKSKSMLSRNRGPADKHTFKYDQGITYLTYRWLRLKNFMIPPQKSTRSIAGRFSESYEEGWLCPL